MLGERVELFCKYKLYYNYDPWVTARDDPNSNELLVHASPQRASCSLFSCSPCSVFSLTLNTVVVMTAVSSKHLVSGKLNTSEANGLHKEANCFAICV